jgi:type II secretory pathway pseudopilin PulG
MQWWNDLVDWITSDDGWRVLSGAILPFVAIVLAGVIGAGIGRSGVRRLVEQRDQETRVAAVAALVSAGQNAARWHSQGPEAREHAPQVATEAYGAARLLPVPGSDLAADWAMHQLEAMRVNSVNFGLTSDGSLAEYQNRLIEWVRHPRRAKQLFVSDLDRWDYENVPVEELQRPAPAN